MFVKKEQFIAVFLVVFAVALLFLSGCLEKTCFNRADCPLSDSEYIQIAKTTSEAQAFLQKYPDANIVAERTEYLAVDFIKNKSGESTIVPPYLRLRVFINTSTNKPASAFIECNLTGDNYSRIDQDIVNYIKIEKCLA